MDSQQFDTFEDVDPETIQRLSKSDTSRFMRCNGRIGSLDATLNGIMDTGGFNSSYISMDWADKLRNTLQPFQIRVGKGIVLFGSSKRTAVVKESFLLTVDIIVNKTKHGKLTTWFNVLDIESGFIIGLPDLVAKLPKLFLGRFRQAIKSYHGLPEELTEKEQELIDMLSHVEKRPARPHLGRNLGSSKQSESYPSEAKLFIIQEPFCSLERGQEVDTWTMDHDEDAHEANEGYPGCITELTHAMSEDTIDHKIAEFLLEVDKPPPEPGGNEARYGPLYIDDVEFKEYLKYEAIHTFTVQPGTKWGLNIEDTHIAFMDTLPTERKVRCRPIARHREPYVMKELDRMCEYMYVPSDSPLASNMVDADKDGPPWVRLCGDYPFMNKHMERRHAWIPDVKHILHKLSGFAYYSDFDMTNSFHQLQLDKISSERLTVITPRGPLRPLYMPEGIKCATPILHNTVSKIFSDFIDEEWMLVLFDNFVIGANSKEELTRRTKLVFQRCREYNLRLKLTKSHFGVTKVEFFGYEVDQTGYKLQPDKTQHIQTIQFPNAPTRAMNVELMQSFLGSANFHQPLYANIRQPDNDHAHLSNSWTELTSPLYDMTNKSFNWDPSTWEHDYKAIFNKLRDCLGNLTKMYHPDYTLPWVLQTDASCTGIGAVLFQIKMEGGKEVRQPIATVSQKFSKTASKWPTIKQEAYAIFKSVEKLEYLLKGKEFKVETDHANLQYLEKSTVAILTRWRIYLQSFDIPKIIHIPGKCNAYADCLSRQPPDDPDQKKGDLNHCDLEYLNRCYELSDFTPEAIYEFNEMERDNWLYQLSTLDDMDDEDIDMKLRMVHGRYRLHFSPHKTMQRFKQIYPDTPINLEQVSDFCDKCDTCQKSREPKLPQKKRAEVKHLMQDDPRKQIGIDKLEMTETKEGYRYMHVIVNHFSKFVYIYKCKTGAAEDAANAILSYMALFGPIENIIHDPGSDYMSNVVKELNKYLGLERKVSLVDRHESNGVEPFNKQIVRHIRAILYDLEYEADWSDERVLSTIMDNLNNLPRDSTGGFTALETHTGIPLPEGLGLNIGVRMDGNFVTEYVQRLKVFKDTVIKASKNFIDNEKQKLAELNAQSNLDKFASGSKVLVRTKERDKEKIDLTWKGPYTVIRHVGNDVELYDDIQDKQINTEYVENVKAYHGTIQQVLDSSRRSAKEHAVGEIVAHYGDPLKRTTLGFYLRFKDNTRSESRYDQIRDNAALDEYIILNKDLLPLLYDTAREWTRNQRSHMADLQKPAYKVGSKVYLDLRCRKTFGADFYLGLELPNKHTYLYVVEATVSKAEKNCLYLCFTDPILRDTIHSQIDLVSITLYLYTGVELNTSKKTVFVRENDRNTLYASKVKAVSWTK